MPNTPDDTPTATPDPASPIDRAAHPLAAQVLDILQRRMFMLYKSTAQDSRSPLAERAPLLDRVAASLIRDQPADQVAGRLERAVKGYIKMSLEFLRLQRQLEKSGHYLLASERDAYEQVYGHDGAYGEHGYYLDGLLLALALWPNHFEFWRYFQQDFIAALGERARIVEIGVGTGFHLAELLAARPEVRYTGIDISALAVDYCKRYVFGPAEPPAHVDFVVENVAAGLRAEDGSCDALIMGEVLEHIEDPAGALRELYRVAAPGAPLFMTTVVFAAAIDHIYMFEDAQSIRDLVATTGWRIDSERVLPVVAEDRPDMRKRPMNYAAVLRK
ncbi:MAG: class I SAM-dependent methyltransferase [Myxococcota bacterium]